NSNWGVQNLRTLTKAIAHHGTNASNVTKFNNDIQIPESKKMLLNIIESADCIVLIANPSQTSTIVKSMSKLNRDQRLPIIGHEALSKDNFIALTNTTIRKNIDLSFVQSCFSFTTNSHSADIQNIKQTLANLNA